MPFLATMAGCRNHYAITAFFTAVMVFISCSEEKIESGDDVGGIKIGGRIESFVPSSRLSVSNGAEGSSLLWTKGDQIKLWPSGNATSAIIFNATAFNASTGEISFVSQGSRDEGAEEKFFSSVEMYAFSASTKANNSENPFVRLSDDPSFSSNKIIISDTQTAVAGSFDPKALPVVSYWKGSIPGEPQLDLKLCCSLLKLHIDVSGEKRLKTITIKNNLKSNAGIAGSFYWKTDSEDVVLSSMSNTSSKITLSPASKDEVIESGEYYIIVAPGRELYHPSVTFEYGDGTQEQFDNYEMDITASEMKRATIFDIGSFSLPKDESKLERIRITESDSWVRIHQKDYIVEGSVLDFSSESMFDAPAGKYGRLKIKDGHFEFEEKSGEVQRFYGTNISNDVNYLSHEQAVAFADRMARSGYNLLRIHHHDNLWNTDENKDRLDFLVSELIKRGIYLTTDLYVSRRVQWRDIGIDRDESIDIQVFKFLVGCLYKPALENWKVYARSFLEHVNPYTGRAYKDEPALCMISLINEGGLKFVWNKAQSTVPDFTEAAYSEYLQSNPANPSDNDFARWFNSRVYGVCSQFVRDLGCETLLSNENNGPASHTYGEGQSEYDYIDEHYYSSGVANPLISSPFYLVYKPKSGEIKTASEWNHIAPSPYRGLGAVLGIAEMSAYGWNSVCRFAFAEHISNMEVSDKQAPTSYCICKDELMLASEPAAVVFFGRNDVTSSSQITIDSSCPSLSINTGKSVAVWKESGTISAGVLSADIYGAPATIFACAFNGEQMTDATRILLTHMTDVQGIGSVLSRDRTNYYVWGSGQVVEVGSADIRLSLSSPSSYKVYAVDASGARVKEVESEVEGGQLCFSISTSTGCLRYEVVK